MSMMRSRRSSLAIRRSPRAGRWSPDSWPNAKVFLVTEPSWSITAAWMSSYLTVYLVARHASVTGIGLAIGISGLLQAAIFPAVGWFSSRIGRKAVIQIGDVLGWIVAIILWIVHVPPIWILIALVLNQVSQVVTPPWNGLFSEDIDAEKRSHLYLLLQVVTILGGSVVPLFAIWEHRLGIAESGRMAFAIALPFLALSIGMRQWLLRESSLERAERTARKTGAWLSTRQRLLPALRGQGRALAGLRVLAQLSFSLFATFAPLTFVEHGGLGIHTNQLAFLPLSASIFGLALWLQHRRIGQLPPHRSLGLAIAALIVGFGLLGLRAPGGFFTLLGAWGCVMTGQSMFWSSHTTYWMTWVPDSARVDVQGYVGALAALLITIAAPLLASWSLAHADLFYWGNFSLAIVLGLLWRSVGRQAQKI